MPPLPLQDIIILLFLVLVLCKIIFNATRRRKIYIIDFACFKPNKSQQITRKKYIEEFKLRLDNLSQESSEHQWKLIMASGIGDMTYTPQPTLDNPPDFSMRGAKREAEGSLYGAIDALMAKTRVQTEHIGVLVVCCTLFSPVPSLAAMIVNRYKLRHDIKTFNLSGMGCSASMDAIGLATQLLQVNENMCAMVVSTEVITQRPYTGLDKRKLVVNCLFRVGSSAILLSNKPSDLNSSKYQLIHTVQTNTSSSDTSYGCVYQEEDSEGLIGVTLTTDLIVEAKKAITEHMTTLGKLILPTSDKILFLLNYLVRKFHLAKVKPYTPDFKSAIDHFFPHVGGKPVIDEVEKKLKLDMEAPRMTLYRFGNLSSSTVWYELAYSEAKRRIKKGDRIWQIAYGSGFKCSSVVLRAMRNVDLEKINPWFDEIDEFPQKPVFEPIPPSYFKRAE